MCIGICLINQLSGQNAVNIYSTTMFEDMGISVSLGNIIVGGSNLLGVVIGIFVMKIGIGYRSAFIIGQFSEGFLLMLIAILQWQGNHETAIVVLIGVFSAVFQIFVGSLTWPYMAQVTVTESGYSASTLSLWLSVLSVSFCSVYLMRSLTTAGTFAFFSIMTLIGGMIFVCFLRESKGVPE